MSVALNAPNLATILVVDGEVLVRFALADYLRDCAYRVVEAASADEATTVIQEAELHIDIVLCEAQLSGEVNGFALAQWIRRQRPGLPIILSGTPAHAAEAAAKLCDEGPNLARPYEPQIVVDRIKRLMSIRNGSEARTPAHLREVAHTIGTGGE